MRTKTPRAGPRIKRRMMKFVWFSRLFLRLTIPLRCFMEKIYRTTKSKPNNAAKKILEVVSWAMAVPP
jgi:hypothetical protein